jgi:ubiquinone/menaquinone biosynthesis C-methylase UbiE
MKTFNLLKLASKTVMFKLNPGDADPANGNDRLTTFDDTYSQYFHASIDDMLAKLSIPAGRYILDLASNTSEFTYQLARQVGETGKVVAVNRSADILQYTHSRAVAGDLANISLVESDAFAFLDEIPANSIDAVVCAWGFCHLKHDKFIKEVNRVLKPGGAIGLIEDRADSLKDVTDLFTKVLIDCPDALIKNPTFNSPKDKDYLVKMLHKHHFEVRSVWEDRLVIPANNGNEVAEYVFKILDGEFMSAFDSKLLPTVMQAFTSYANERFTKGWEDPLLHKFCAIIGTKKIV